jgi:hypothetical protein
MDLMVEARRLGVRVTIDHIEGGQRMGEYCHAEREIVLGLGLTMPQLKEAFAHELGHAQFGHECSSGPYERRADRRAAALLIDLAAYQVAEAIDPDPQFIADELGVTRRMVRVFQKEHLPALALRRRTA